MTFLERLRLPLVFLLFCTLVFPPFIAANAQNARSIKATGTITTPDGITIPFTMEFIPAGGAVTGKIEFKSEVPWRNSDTGTCPSTLKLEFTGNFAGGDGGEAGGNLTGEEDTICGPTSHGGEWGGGSRVVYGTDAILKYGQTDWRGNFYANGTGSGSLHFWYRVKDWDFSNGPVEASWKVTFSPQEFQGEVSNPAAAEAPTETEEVATPACTPQIRGLDGLKPGDVISPGAAYTDAAGKEVGIIQERWYINGQETSSANWNGQKTVVELQFTCLDHKGGTVSLVIPAYQQPPADQAPAGQPPVQPPAGQPPVQPPAGQPPAQPPDASAPSAPASSSSSNLFTAVMGLGLAGAGALGLTGLAGFWISRILKAGSTPAPSQAPTRSSPSVQPPAPRPPSAPIRPATQAQPQPRPEAPSKKAGESIKKDGGDGGEAKDDKGVLDAVKDAAENYGKSLESLSDPLNKIKEKLGEDKVLPPNVKEKITRYINSLTEPLEKVKNRAEEWSKGIGQYTDLRDKAKSITNELDKNIEEIAKGRQKALEDLKNLPPGAANAAADMSAALDGLGRISDAALDKIPGYKQLGGEKTFEVSKSFREAGKGLQKAIKTIKTSETEAIDLSKNGDSIPGYTPKGPDPEIEKIRKEAAKNRPQSTWEWWKEIVRGKTPDESVKQFR